MNSYCEIIESINSSMNRNGLVYWRTIHRIPLAWFFHQPLIMQVYKLKKLWGDQPADAPELLQRIQCRLQRSFRQTIRRVPPLQAIWLVGSSHNIRHRRGDGTLGHYLYDGIREYAQSVYPNIAIAEAQWLGGNELSGTAYPDTDIYLDVWLRNYRLRHFRSVQRLTSALMQKVAPIFSWIDRLDRDLALQGELKFNIQKMTPKLIRNIAIATLGLKSCCDQMEPRALAVVCYYSVGNRILVDLCNQQGIPTYDLQHGVISPGHPGYHLGKQLNIAVLPLPSRVLCFGSFWKRLLLELSPWRAQKLPIIGNLGVESLRTQPPEQRSRIHSELRKQLGISPNQRILLVTTNLSMAAALLQFIRQSGILSHGSWRIIVKQHPIYDLSKGEVHALIGNAVTIIRSEQTLADLLVTCDAHLTVHSTTIFDALAAGLPNFVAKVSPWQYVDYVIAQGLATLVEPTELIPALENTTAGYTSKIMENVYARGLPAQAIIDTIQQDLSTAATQSLAL